MVQVEVEARPACVMYAVYLTNSQYQIKATDGVCGHAPTHPDKPGNTAETVALTVTVWPDIGVSVPVPWMVEIGVMVDPEHSPSGVASVAHESVGSWLVLSGPAHAELPCGNNMVCLYERLQQVSVSRLGRMPITGASRADAHKFRVSSWKDTLTNS